MYFEKSWKSCYESYRKIAENSPIDAENDTTPELCMTDKLKPYEKNKIAEIKKSTLNRNLTRKTRG